jgi:hypothetical protein
VAPVNETPLSAATAGLPTSGLVLWLRGDRGISKSADQRVCAWADQSGTQRPSFTSRNARPLWVANGLGSQAAVHFDAVATDLVADGVLGLSPTSPRTFIAVVQLVSTAGRFHAFSQGLGGSAETYLMLDANTWKTVGSREGLFVAGNCYDTQTATSVSPRVHVYALDTLTPGATVLGSVDYRIDGVTQTLTRKQGSTKFLDFAGANFTSVGSVDAISSVAPAVGDAFVAEVLVYDRSLTVPERGVVEAALKTRYAIP